MCPFLKAKARALFSAFKNGFVFSTAFAQIGREAWKEREGKGLFM